MEILIPVIYILQATQVASFPCAIFKNIILTSLVSRPVPSFSIIYAAHCVVIQCATLKSWNGPGDEAKSKPLGLVIITIVCIYTLLYQTLTAIRADMDEGIAPSSSKSSRLTGNGSFIHRTLLLKSGPILIPVQSISIIPIPRVRQSIGKLKTGSCCQHDRKHSCCSLPHFHRFSCYSIVDVLSVKQL